MTVEIQLLGKEASVVRQETWIEDKRSVMVRFICACRVKARFEGIDTLTMYIFLFRKSRTRLGHWVVGRIR